MSIMPLPFLLGTLAGILSVGVLLGGAYVVWAWYVGTSVGAAWLAAGIGMLAWSLLGRYLVLAMYRRGEDDPLPEHAHVKKTITAPDGSDLHLEFEGDADTPVIVLTHGWALDSTAWYYIRKQLAQHYRLVLWDLPGLGQSTQPRDHKYSVNRLAEDLHQVIMEAGDKPVTLVGHSIGGMMILTLCRLHPELLKQKVNGIVLIDTTHTWPLRTVIASGLMRLIRWPIIEPLLLLTILLWPLVWLMNVQSYLNGTSHIVNRLTSLSGDVTRGQLDFAARYNMKDNPAVIAKGLQAVLRWDETQTPKHITVPTHVVAGHVDRLTKPEAGVQISEEVPGASFTKITPAGHNGLLEEGRQYSEAISQLVRRAVGGQWPNPSIAKG
jgi:pimeloyl-ACP methyl ester carboxylesterase